MRILTTTELWFPDYVGGSARVAREVASALAKRGHEVIMVAPALHNEPSVSHVDGIELHRVVKRSEVVPRTYTDAPMYGLAVRRLRLGTVEVILGQHVASMLGARAALPHVPCSHVFHASGLREARQRRGYGVSLGAAGRSVGVEPGLKLLEFAGARLADQLLVLSDFSRGLLIEDQGARIDEKIVKVGGGVDTARYGPADDRAATRASLACAPDEVVLLTVRRLVQRMGLENLLAAFARLAADDSALTLVMVGDGELREALKRQAATLGIDSRVRWTGRVDDAELIRWYQAADLFVLPTAAMEGFGISTVESLACGTPVIGTPVGATPEVLGSFDAGMITADAGPEALAAAIRATVPRLSPDLRARVREHAVNTFSWEKVSARWERALEDLIASHPKTRR
jgi:glycosyltransferase involved in cell wall biosynthesis